jgi:hypothetical protein
MFDEEYKLEAPHYAVFSNFSFTFAEKKYPCVEASLVYQNEQAGTCIREVLLSNHGRDTDSPDRVSSYFSSVPPGKCPESASIRPRSIPSKSLPIHDSYIIRHYTNSIQKGRL